MPYNLSPSTLKRFVSLFLFALCCILTGCANMYVDNGTREVPIAQYKKPVEPKPVQLLFEFQTKGTFNSRATNHLKDQVIELAGLLIQPQTHHHTSDPPVAASAREWSDPPLRPPPLPGNRHIKNQFPSSLFG